MNKRTISMIVAVCLILSCVIGGFSVNAANSPATT